MKEKPILFSGPMVRAILDGSKTQTRRVVKPQPNNAWAIGATVAIANDGTLRWASKTDNGLCVSDLKCPYGQTGDRLWVRETWAAPTCFDAEKPRDLPESLAEGGIDSPIIYRERSPGYRVKELGSFWRPSIFMPRWASRITLEIVGVRVERVQNISEQDAEAEGVDKSTPFKWQDDEWQNTTPNKARFAHIWDCINKARGYGWECNPFVWAIEFRRLN